MAGTVFADKSFKNNNSVLIKMHERNQRVKNNKSLHVGGT